MSTKAEFSDVSAFSTAMTSVRSDSSKENYIIVGHVGGNPNVLEVVDTGEDVEEIAGQLKDTQVMYVLARYESTFDMSNTIKFVYFHWIGDKVPFATRGRCGVVHGSVEEFFEPYHMFIETSSVDDFYTDKIKQQLEENTGKKSKVLDSADIKGRQERGFTQSQLPKRGPTQTTGPAISKAGASVDISDEVVNDIGEVRFDNNETRWMLSEYKGGKKGPIDSVAKGTGDISELTEHLKDDKAMYGLYRVTDSVDNITTVKFVYIQWVGPNVKPMMKAKLSTHKGTVQDTFHPFHITIYAEDHSEISEKIIMDKVTSASGTKSHVM